MKEKDAPTDDEAKSRERPKRELGNPRERQRSFLRQRAAILRPHDDPSGETNTQPPAQQEDAAVEQDDDAKPSCARDERRKLLAQYRRRQRGK